MGTSPQEQQETLDIVIDELDRISRFIDELVLLAKAERPDFLFPETIDLTAFTEELFAKVTALGDRQRLTCDHPWGRWTDRHCPGPRGRV